ncbi:MAG TPA: TIGR00159 family protein [Firmicutes bacterium]|jgi:diadenylate cyclase|nr:TIGR00159 family protein [Bacillota bacterium]
MTLGEIYTIFTKVLDVAILWFIFYYILKYIRKNVKLTLIFKGVLIIVLLKLVSVWLDLNTVGVLLEYVIESVPIAIIVLFQPEIRNVLESIGRSQLLGRHKVLTVDEREKVVYEIMQAVEYMKRNRIGALMVIERDYSLSQYIENANKLYADISSELLISIFFPNNPLHDGAVIIEGDRITCAGSVLPTSMNQSISKRLGTRHRAALGISEVSDAISVVVSEETGRVSIAMDGELNYNLTLEDARMMLIEGLQPKKETFFDAESNLPEEMEEVNDEQKEQN